MADSPSLFSCQYRQQLIYQTPDGSFDAQTPVTSVFVHPIIGVEEEGKDLYDCLAELYLGGADIEYEGKKGHMMDLMDSFPPMLYIQMRVGPFRVLKRSGPDKRSDPSLTWPRGASERPTRTSRSSRPSPWIDFWPRAIRTNVRNLSSSPAK